MLLLYTTYICLYFTIILSITNPVFVILYTVLTIYIIFYVIFDMSIGKHAKDIYGTSLDSIVFFNSVNYI